MSRTYTKWTREALKSALQDCFEISLAEQGGSPIASPDVTLQSLANHIGISKERVRQLFNEFGLPTNLKTQCDSQLAEVLKVHAARHTLKELYELNPKRLGSPRTLSIFLTIHGITWKNKFLKNNSKAAAIRNIDFDTAMLTPEEILIKAQIELPKPKYALIRAGLPFKTSPDARLKESRLK